ncbi:PREDICTED: testis-expressed sequence 12 protein isoform X2 [Myotis brandtii]|uniref:testis-expressed sequence 12 protein isoform X2 n=1 Tax=Myotis brandtii TaxID=109478 RepID=UPI0007047E35|nr:PREDICTED: testis-expressed sequence 12 protein isoform X2 [Myotis brandtii]
MFRISIFEIAGQSRHIKAPNRLSFKDVGHACYKIYFFESCQLSELNSFTHQESDFRRFRDSRSSVAPKKKGSRDEGSDQEVLLAARGTQYKPFRHPNHLESDVNVAPQMPDSPQLSSLGKSDSSFSESSGLFDKDESLEKDLNDMSKEINLMLSTYAKILSERAAVDASYIDEIEGLFKEANTIENFLVQKRELLRQRFTVIANTLHS